MTTWWNNARSTWVKAWRKARLDQATKATAPPPRTAPAADHPCELHEYHAPRVLRTQLHHSRPVYLQNRVYGRIVHPGDMWLCGTDHDSIHEVIDWLLGEGRKPNPGPGWKTRRAAEKTVAWYRRALAEKENAARG